MPIPALLRSYLQAKIPDDSGKAEIVQEIRPRFSEFRREHGGERIPVPPEDFGVVGLNISVRTYHCLTRMGVENISDIGRLTFNDLLRCPNFGVTSLVDLLLALNCFETPEAREQVDSQQISSEDESETFPDQMDRWCQACRILEIKGGASVKATDRRFGLLLQRAAPEFSSLDDFVVAAQEEKVCKLRRNQLSLFEQLVEGVLAAKGISLNEEIHSLLTCIVTNDRNVKIFAHRYAFSGGEENTLEVTGRHFGITRQRVDQICSSVQSKLPLGDYLPVLDETLKVISECLPNTAEIVESELLSRGLVSIGFRVESIATFARMTGREPGFEITNVESGRLVAKSGTPKKVSQVLRFVRKEIKNWGGARLTNVLNHFVADPELNDDIVREIVYSQTDLAWLDKEHEWFWFSDNKVNRILNRMEKIWSVTSQIRLGELREAIRRHYRMQGSAPPLAILAEMCRQDERLLLVADSVTWRLGLLIPDALSQIERTMVNVLNNLGSITGREQFESACSDVGVSRETFYMYIDNSPVFKKFSRGVYGVVGHEATLTEIENLRPKHSRGRVLQDFGWISGSKIWIGYRLSEATVRSGLLSIPEALKAFITGNFSLADGTTVTVWKQGTLAIGNFLECSGCKSGDFIALIFDLTTQSLRSELESERVLREYLN